MKTRITSIILLAGIGAFSLLLNACSTLQTGGTHEMGPPGRSETMANGFMIEQGGGEADF